EVAHRRPHEGEAPQLHRGRDYRRPRQHRRGHHHRELRRQGQASARQRRPLAHGLEHGAGRAGDAGQERHDRRGRRRGEGQSAGRHNGRRRPGPAHRPQDERIAEVSQEAHGEGGEETLMKKGLLVFSGGANPALGAKVTKFLGLDAGKIEINRFPDGEIDMKILEDVRGADVYVIQSTCPPVNENLMELLIMIDCLRRASAERITAVIPYFGYARQDRKAEGRVPISAKLVANVITAAGVSRALAVDLHAAPVLVDYFRRLDIKDLTIVSPDVGGIKMARAYAKRLNADLAIVDKRR